MSEVIQIAVTADAARARAELDSVTRATDGMSSKLKGGIALAAAGAGVALAGMATEAIAGARESAQIHRVLESQIKSMGGAAATAFSSATQFAEDYGTAIGKDDDDILKVINKLSTFPAAFDKGSLGAEGMRRATQAAFNLEAAGVGSAESNIIGLGKAMDNPIKGLTALSKSGVSFTAEQKKQIEQYTKSGDLAKAQAVLLQGIESNAKSAANAQADGMTRAKVALDGFAEGVATKLLPYLDRFGAWFTDTGLPAIERFGAWFGTNVAPKIKDAFTVGKDAAQGLITLLSNPAVQAFAAAIAGVVVSLRIYAAVTAAIRAVTAAWAVVQAVLNAVMMANPIGLIVLAVVALVAAIVILWKRSETFREIVTKGWEAIKSAISAVVDWFTTTVPKMWDSVVAAWDSVKDAAAKTWDAIKAAAQAVWDAIVTAVNVFVALVTAYLNAWKTVLLAIWNAIKAAAVAVWNGIQAAVQLVIDFLTRSLNGWRTLVLNVWSAIKTAAITAWNAISGAVKTVVDKVNGFIIGLRDKVKSTFSNAASLLLSAGSDLVAGFKRGISNAWSSFTGWIRDQINKIPAVVRRALGINSPSRVFRTIGEQTGEGLVLGMQSQSGAIERAAQAMVSIPGAQAIEPLVAISATAGGAASVAPSAPVTIEQVIVQGTFDLRSPEERRALAAAAVREIQAELVAYEGSRR